MRGLMAKAKFMCEAYAHKQSQQEHGPAALGEAVPAPPSQGSSVYSQVAPSLTPSCASLVYSGVARSFTPSPMSSVHSRALTPNPASSVFSW